MPFSFRILAPSLALGLAVAACVPPPPEPVYPQITFRTLAPFRLAVASVELVEAYRPPLRAPHVEHESPVPPAVPLRRWVSERLVAAGGAGTVRATIRDARITETALPVNQDFEATLRTEQVARFDGRVELVVEVLDERGMQLAAVHAEATRSRTLPEDATLREREEILFQIAEDLANDLNRVLEENIPRYLGAYLVP
jgi:hypothetical protein